MSIHIYFNHSFVLVTHITRTDGPKFKFVISVRWRPFAWASRVSWVVQVCHKNLVHGGRGIRDTLYMLIFISIAYNQTRNFLLKAWKMLSKQVQKINDRHFHYNPDSLPPSLCNVMSTHTHTHSFGCISWITSGSRVYPASPPPNQTPTQL